MKNKISKALYYKEHLYLLWGFIKKLISIRNSIYRFYLPILKRIVQQKVFFVNLADFKNELRTKIGNFSNYKTHIDVENKSELLNSADRILSHEFNIFGASKKYENKIDWHTDFKSGYTWAKGTYYVKYRQVDLNNNADVKIPRELSRSHHLIIIGQAYLLSSNEDYTKEFIEEIEDWIEENPLMYSINWGCAMDVAIRASNWIFALTMFIDSVLITKDFLFRILKSLYEHGIFISNNLERSYKIGANHLDGDIGGLLLIGLVFNHDKKGKRWFDISKYILYDEIRKQILPSGMEIEKSIYYNRLVLEIFAYSIFILKRNSYQIPADIEYRIHSMFRFVRELMLDDLSLPIIGDYDSARYIPFDYIYRNDVVYLCNLAKKYYCDEYFKCAHNQNHSEDFFLINNDKKISCNFIPQISANEINDSVFYSDIGIIKMKSHNMVIIINNSSPGRYVDDPFLGGSHAHADLLSFVLAKGKQQIFIDPGSGVYTSNYTLRNILRSTSLHNTVNINKMSQFKINEKVLFDYDSKVEVKNIQFTKTDRVDIYEGEHNAYSYLIPNLIHRRKYEFHKNTDVLLVTDTIINAVNTSIDICFHLHPNIKPIIEDQTIYLHIDDQIIAIIEVNSKKERFSLNQIDIPYSNAYGYVDNTKSIVISGKIINQEAIYKTTISIK